LVNLHPIKGGKSGRTHQGRKELPNGGKKHVERERQAAPPTKIGNGMKIISVQLRVIVSIDDDKREERRAFLEGQPVEKSVLRMKYLVLMKGEWVGGFAWWKVPRPRVGENP